METLLHALAVVVASAQYGKDTREPVNTMRNVLRCELEVVPEFTSEELVFHFHTFGEFMEDSFTAKVMLVGDSLSVYTSAKHTYECNRQVDFKTVQDTVNFLAELVRTQDAHCVAANASWDLNDHY